MATTASALLAVLLGVATAAARPVELSRATIVDLMRQAPESRANAARAGVSRAAVSAAGVLSLENPLVSGLGGVRFNPDGGRRFAGAVTLSWPVDTGGKRSSRLDAANAEHRGALASAEAQQRRLLLALLLRHATVLRDEQQMALAEARHANAERVLEMAQKRREAGSVPPLDVSLASLQERRDAAAALSAQGEHRAALVGLAALLGVPVDRGIVVVGALVPPDEPPALEFMLRRVEERADLQAATARVQAARARANREDSAASPTVNLLAQYERDEGSNIGTLGVAVPLSLLNANASAKATSVAEIQAASAERSALRATAIGEIREHYARYDATRGARQALAPTTSAVKESVALATRAYELGEGDLASVLLVHREALEAQQALLEAEHAHAVAKLELLVSAGRTPR